MNTSANTDTRIDHLEFKDKIYIHLSSSDTLTIPYDYSRKLGQANRSSLENYRLIGGGIGIHFEDIDEDISLNGIIRYKLKNELLAS